MEPDVLQLPKQPVKGGKAGQLVEPVAGIAGEPPLDEIVTKLKVRYCRARSRASKPLLRKSRRKSSPRKPLRRWKQTDRKDRGFSALPTSFADMPKRSMIYGDSPLPNTSSSRASFTRLLRAVVAGLPSMSSNRLADAR